MASVEHIAADNSMQGLMTDLRDRKGAFSWVEITQSENVAYDESAGKKTINNILYGKPRIKGVNDDGISPYVKEAEEYSLLKNTNKNLKKIASAEEGGGLFFHVLDPLKPHNGFVEQLTSSDLDSSIDSFLKSRGHVNVDDSHHAILYEVKSKINEELSEKGVVSEETKQFFRASLGDVRKEGFAQVTLRKVGNSLSNMEKAGLAASGMIGVYSLVEGVMGLGHLTTTDPETGKQKINFSSAAWTSFNLLLGAAITYSTYHSAKNAGVFR